jgi:hypothetical protein
MNYQWSITETQVKDGLILCAKYHVAAQAAAARNAS